MDNYIRTIMQKFEVHATMTIDPDDTEFKLLDGIVNHGVVSHQEYKELLHKAKVMSSMTSILRNEHWL